MKKLPLHDFVDPPARDVRVRRCFACRAPAVAHLCVPCIELLPPHMVRAVAMYSGPALLHIALWVRYLRLERKEVGTDRG